MKEIKVIVRAFVAQRIVEALEAVVDLPCVSLSQVTMLSRPFPRAGFVQDEQVSLAVVVPSAAAPEIVNVIARIARSEGYREGRVYITSLGGSADIRDLNCEALAEENGYGYE